jgi:hypothetical protein
MIPLKCLFHLLLAFSTVVHGRPGEDESSPRHLRGDNDRLLAPAGTDVTTSTASAGTELRYIVVYKDSFFANAEMTLNATLTTVEQLNGTVKHQYDTVFNGMAVTMTPAAATTLAQNAEIASVVVDTPVYMTTTWGLDRLDQQSLPGNGLYKWESDAGAGSGVNVCVSETITMVEDIKCFVDLTAFPFLFSQH